jgi:hypothetical protein
MLALLRHLLGADYLYALHPLTAGPGSQGVLGPALMLAALTAAGALWLRRARRQGVPLSAPRAMLACTLAAWGMLTTQIYGSGPFSARVWTLTGTALALAVPVAAWLAKRRWPEALRPIGHGLACAVDPLDPSLTARQRIAWTAGHVLMLLALFWRSLAHSQDPSLIGGVAGVAAVCLLMATLASATKRDQPVATGARPLRIELLAPLLVLYGASLLQWTAGSNQGDQRSGYGNAR